MLRLPALSKKYKKFYPEYIDPLAKFSPNDTKLAAIKRQALNPYLSSLEEQRILYDDHILVSAFLFDVEINENGFIAELWKIKTHQLLQLPLSIQRKKNLDHPIRLATPPPPWQPNQLPPTTAGSFGVRKTRIELQSIYITFMVVILIRSHF